MKFFNAQRLTSNSTVERSVLQGKHRALERTGAPALSNRSSRRELFLLHRHKRTDWDLGEEFAGGFLGQPNASV